jgi:hypothetical protein
MSSHPLIHGRPGVDRVSREECFVRFSVIFDLIAENTCLTRIAQLGSGFSLAKEKNTLTNTTK